MSETENINNTSLTTETNENEGKLVTTGLLPETVSMLSDFSNERYINRFLVPAIEQLPPFEQGFILDEVLDLTTYNKEKGEHPEVSEHVVHPSFLRKNCLIIVEKNIPTLLSKHPELTDKLLTKLSFWLTEAEDINRFESKPLLRTFNEISEQAKNLEIPNSTFERTLNILLNYNAPKELHSKTISNYDIRQKIKKLLVEASAREDNHELFNSLVNKLFSTENYLSIQSYNELINKPSISKNLTKEEQENLKNRTIKQLINISKHSKQEYQKLSLFQLYHLANINNLNLIPKELKIQILKAANLAFDKETLQEAAIDLTKKILSQIARTTTKEERRPTIKKHMMKAINNMEEYSLRGFTYRNNEYYEIKEDMDLFRAFV